MGLHFQKADKNLRNLLLLISILIVILPVVLPLLLISILVRGIIRGLAKLFRPDLDSFVAGEAALFAVNNSNVPALNILIVTLMKGPMSVETFRRHMEERVLQCTDPQTGIPLYQELKKTWEGFLGYAFWKTDLNFDIRNHVREYDYGGGMKIRSPCKLKELHSVLGRLHVAPWDRDRSPWEMLRFPNVISEDGEKCTAMILRVEHTLADGYSLLGLFKALTQSQFSVPKTKVWDRKFTFLEKLALVFKAPWDFFNDLVEVVSFEQLKRAPFSKETPSIVSVSPQISVDLIKSIKDHYGVSYAAVTYAAVLGAIQRAVKATGQEAPERLSAGIILPKIGHPKKGLVVYASATFVNLTFKAVDATARLRAIDAEILALGKSCSFLVAPILAEIMALFPISFRRATSAWFIDLGLTFGITNFPVSTTPEYWDGHEIVSSFGGCGTLSPIGMVITMGGVNNKQVIQIAVNSSVFEDLKEAQSLASYVAEEIQELAAEIGH